MSLELPFGIKVLGNESLDWKYGPWASLAAAKAAIPLALRKDGLTVQITGSGNYWWLDSDLTDTGLIAKTGATSYKKEIFTAGVSQHIFTVVTGTINQIVNVTVNGVEQDEGTNFTVSGNSIDFGTNVPSGAKVSIKYFESLLIGGGGTGASSGSGITLSGTNVNFGGTVTQNASLPGFFDYTFGGTSTVDKAKNFKVYTKTGSLLDTTYSASTGSLLGNTSLGLGTFGFASPPTATVTVTNVISGGFKIYSFRVGAVDGDYWNPTPKAGPVNITTNGTQSVGNYDPIAVGDVGIIAPYVVGNTLLVVVPNNLTTYPYVSYFYSTTADPYTGWFASPISGYEITSATRPIDIARANTALNIAGTSSITSTFNTIDLNTKTIGLTGIVNITGNTTITGNSTTTGLITGGSLSIPAVTLTDSLIDLHTTLIGGAPTSILMDSGYLTGTSHIKIDAGSTNSGLLEILNEIGSITLQDSGNIVTTTINSLVFTAGANISLTASSGDISIDSSTLSISAADMYVYPGSSLTIDGTGGNDINIISGQALNITTPGGLNINTSNASTWTFDDDISINYNTNLFIHGLFTDNTKTKLIVLDSSTGKAYLRDVSSISGGGGGGGGTGTVTDVSVATANGFGGTVATSTTTPVITLSTSITGLLKGNGTAMSAATAGTDYLTPTGSAAGLTSFPTFNQNTTGSAATLTTGRTISITGDLTYTSPSFNGSGNVTAAGTIVASAVTLAKMADVATSTVFYRKTAGTGAPEVQTLATLKTDLGLTGTNSGDQTITLTGNVTGSGTGSFATTIANAAVTYAKIQNVAANSFLANATGSAATVQEIATTRIPLFASAITGTPSSTTYLRGDGQWTTPTASAAWGSITGTLSSQTDLQTALDAKQNKALTLNTQTTSYTLVLTDKDSILVEMNSASALNLTVPLNATVAFPIGTQIPVVQKGAGLVTVVATGGVTINSSSGSLVGNGQNTVMVLTKRATDEWYLWNGLSTTISRTITITSGSATMGSTAYMDYVYLVAGLHTMTLPTAVSNTNKYTVKNNHSANITVNTTSSQTVDGSLTITLAPNDSVDLISNNSNWFII